MTRFIAEIGSNHNRDLERALALVEASARAGAHAIKLQVFRVEDLFAPEVLASRSDLRARRGWELPPELLEPIAERCGALGVELGATPFGLWAIEALTPHVDFFKVASYELLWHELIRACAATGRPLVISTGMASVVEIDAAVARAREGGCQDLRLLHCVSGYPAPPEQCNLAAIGSLRERYGCPVGWSDHSARVDVVVRAVRRWGASDVELHVDLDGAGSEAGAHNWTPPALARLIAGLGEPRPMGDGSEAVETGAVRAARVPRAARDPGPVEDLVTADGDGVKRPMPVELPDVAWRADPADGLRPLLAARMALRRAG